MSDRNYDKLLDDDFLDDHNDRAGIGDHDYFADYDDLLNYLLNDLVNVDQFDVDHVDHVDDLDLYDIDHRSGQRV